MLAALVDYLLNMVKIKPVIKIIAFKNTSMFYSLAFTVVKENMKYKF